ncbi:HAAS signaling domain-containing protein [Sporosarcina limicola]|uniref:Membrane protein n=1 Tax=Sporosarcina limicola TaxID=34101 RepID=A0A927RDJ1_9BACL|nr:DUF1700 domain-containing protein [Sporosarcina limicola]MBE1555390.1 putative membrane protein [Sporosarcina limicola]
MKKDEFQRDLRALLVRIPKEEQIEIMKDLEEYFENGKLDGKTEEQITASLDSPKNMAKELLVSYRLEKAEATATTGTIFRAVWAIIGLGFFNLIIVLGPFLCLVGVLLGGWTASVGFIAAPLLVLANIVIFPGIFEWFDIFASIAFCGIGLFVAIGMFTATKVLMNGFVRYLKFNTKLVKGGLTHVER